MDAVLERIFQKQEEITDVEESLESLRNTKDDLMIEIKHIKERYDNEKKRLRCPVCHRAFTEEYIIENKKEDEDGIYWECPNRMCEFQYRKNTDYPIVYPIIFGKLLDIWKKHHEMFIQKHFRKLDEFIFV